MILFPPQSPMKLLNTIRNLSILSLVLLTGMNCNSVRDNRAIKQSSRHLFSVQNGRIISPEGNVTALKGCNLGNWLVLEMWMLDQVTGKVHDQYTFESVLEERFGNDKKHELMELYRKSWITEKDFKTVKSFGMNTVRLPFQYTVLMDEDKPYSLRKDAWVWLDRAVEWAEKNELSVILDLHGAPGRQSGMDHTGRVNYNRLWKDKEYQDQTSWLWKEISRHYMTNPTIAAYDLLNEPWGGTEEELCDIIFRLFKEIRNLGDKHIMIFPGHYSGIDFYIEDIEPNFTNYIYTAHFYPGFFGWGAPVPQVHAEFIGNGLKDWQKKMERLNIPLLVGEFNVVAKKAGGGEMMRRYYDVYEEYGWPATMWSYKVLTKQGGIKEMNWGMVTNEDSLLVLDLNNDSMSEIESWFRGLSSMKIAVDEDLRFWMTTDEKTFSLADLPPLPPPIKSVDVNDHLPENWSVTDIGGSLAGGQKINKDAWTIYGGGNDIWASSDQFRFVYTKVYGDFSYTVSVDELLNTHSYAKAGLMARNNLDKHSSHALINIFPYGNTEFGYRSSDGETMSAISGLSLSIPGAKLKLERKENTLTGMVYVNDRWTASGSVTIPGLNKSVFLGLATLSHDNSQLTKAVYSGLKISQNN
mgnify:FL=1